MKANRKLCACWLSHSVNKRQLLSSIASLKFEPAPVQTWLDKRGMSVQAEMFIASYESFSSLFLVVVQSSLIKISDELSLPSFKRILQATTVSTKIIYEKVLHVPLPQIPPSRLNFPTINALSTLSRHVGSWFATPAMVTNIFQMRENQLQLRLLF